MYSSLFTLYGVCVCMNSCIFPSLSLCVCVCVSVCVCVCVWLCSRNGPTSVYTDVSLSLMVDRGPRALMAKPGVPLGVLPARPTRRGRPGPRQCVGGQASDPS